MESLRLEPLKSEEAIIESSRQFMSRSEAIGKGDPNGSRFGSHSVTEAMKRQPSRVSKTVSSAMAVEDDGQPLCILGKENSNP